MTFVFENQSLCKPSTKQWPAGDRCRFPIACGEAMLILPEHVVRHCAGHLRSDRQTGEYPPSYPFSIYLGEEQNLKQTRSQKAKFAITTLFFAAMDNQPPKHGIIYDLDNFGTLDTHSNSQVRLDEVGLTHNSVWSAKCTNPTMHYVWVKTFFIEDNPFEPFQQFQVYGQLRSKSHSVAWITPTSCRTWAVLLSKITRRTTAMLPQNQKKNISSAWCMNIYPRCQKGCR